MSAVLEYARTDAFWVGFAFGIGWSALLYVVQFIRSLDGGAA